MRRRNEGCPCHLNVDEHCVEGRIEPEPSDELEHLAVGVTGLVPAREAEEFVQGPARHITVPLRSRRGPFDHRRLLRIRAFGTRHFPAGLLRCERPGAPVALVTLRDLARRRLKAPRCGHLA